LQTRTAAWVSLARRQFVPAGEDTLTAIVDTFHRERFVGKSCLDIFRSKVLSMRHLYVKPSVDGIVRAVAGTPVAHLQHTRSRSECTPTIPHDDDVTS